MMMRRRQQVWSYVRLAHVALCLLLLLLAVGRVSVHGADSDDLHGSKYQFDPDADVDITTKDCGIPTYQDTDNYFDQRQGLCSTSTSTSTSTGSGSGTTGSLSSLDNIPDSDLHRLAVTYAPVLFFHPLEKYRLSAVNYTLPVSGSGDDAGASDGGGRIFRQTKEDPEPYLVQPLLNNSFLLQTSRDPIYALNPTTFWFETDRAYEMYSSGPDARFGDGYDPQTGLSNAPVYYNVYETGNDIWTFNYWFYYPFNGEGNMGVLSTYNGTTQYTPFTLKPYGIHEGDWESINVMICAPPLAQSLAQLEEDAEPEDTPSPPPLSVKYHQHEWSEILDCIQGECRFYKHSYHPVGFVALNTHATYPRSVAELVYTEIQIGFFYSLQAFVVVDRTVFKKEDGTYNWYFPTTTNLERMQYPYSLNTDNNNNNNNTSTSSSEERYHWQGYGGRWGNSDEIKIPLGEPPLCLQQNQLAYVQCPTPDEDPVFDFVMQVMAVRPATKGDVIAETIQSVTSKVAEIFSQTKKAPLGPGAKGFWERWIPPRNAPFWALQENETLTSEDYCHHKLYDVDDTYREPVTEIADTHLQQQIVLVTVVSAIITLLNIIVPLVIMCLWGRGRQQGNDPQQPILFDPDTNIPQDPMQDNDYGGWQYMMGALVYSLFFFVMIVSGITFVASCDNLFQNLSHWIPNVDWGYIFMLLETLGVLIILINTILLVFLWLQVYEMRNMIRGTYQQLVQVQQSAAEQQQQQVEEEEQPSSLLVFHGDHHYVTWNPRLVDGLFRCSFALLFLSLLFSLICFLVGILAVGAAFAIVYACNTVSGAVDNFCLDLEVFGIPRVACGDDFRALCHDWSSANGKDLLWSGFFAFVSHFYLVAATGFAAQQRRSIPSMLDQYNVLVQASPLQQRRQAAQTGDEALVKPVEDTAGQEGPLNDNQEE